MTEKKLNDMIHAREQSQQQMDNTANNIDGQQQRIQDKSVAMEGSNKIVDGAVDLGKGAYDFAKNIITGGSDDKN